MQLKYSHRGPCAFPYDLDAEWVVGNKDLVKPVVLVGLRSSGNGQRHWDLITFCARVPDLDSEGMFVCQRICVSRKAGCIEVKRRRVGEDAEKEET